MMTISMDDLFHKVSDLSPNEIIVDVREPEEFRTGHVPGSRNIPLGTVTEHANELKKYERVFVHCQRGRRSVTASDALMAAGLTNIVCVAGTGMADWIAAGYPVEI